jgi:PadR family transcriptional regulator AphA
MEHPAESLSPVATLCLAILHHGEATGYEIKKLSVEGDFSYFVDASFGAIYPALARLANEELVTQREEVQSGRPSRKVYQITERGRRALLAALSEPPGADVYRSPFLLVAKFAPHLPRAVVESALGERRRRILADLAHLEELEGRHGDAASRWILGYGRACLSSDLAYLDANAPALVAAAGSAGDGRLAAE